MVQAHIWTLRLSRRAALILRNKACCFGEVVSLAVYSGKALELVVKNSFACN